MQNDQQKRPFALILAAGGSRRLGHPKQLLEIDGEALIRRTLRRAGGLCGRRLVTVLGCEWQQVLAAAGDATGFFLLNDDWRAGIGSSLSIGIRALPDDCAAVMILLADQPLIDGGDLRRLADAWSRAPTNITASRYDGTVGVPAIFPRDLFPELLALGGDRGAKPILSQHRERLTLVDCAHARVDIDTPEDAARLERRPDAGD